MNAVVLAYLGDAVWELRVREYLTSLGFSSTDKLHKMAVNYTSAKAQVKIIKFLLENGLLNNDEKEIYIKGKNQKLKTPKTLDKTIYHIASGFETLIGYLYFHDKIRLDNLMIECINCIKGETDAG